MSENIPNVPPASGSVPPKPADAAKMQQKKETVRINLPPKPTASPTIKLPTLPPTGPTGAAPAAAPAAPRAAAAPAAGAPRPAGTSATVSRPAPAAAATAPRAAAPVMTAGVSGLDKGLAIGAVIACLLALVSSAYVGFMLTNVAQ